MEQKGIETLKDTIIEVLEVVTDVKTDLSDGKISVVEGASLVIKHGGKAVRFVKAITEIKDEVIDLDDVEASELYDTLQSHFGGSDEAKEAIKKLVVGAVNISQGIQGLLDLKKV